MIELVCHDSSCDCRLDSCQAISWFGQGALPDIVEFAIAEMAGVNAEVCVNAWECHAAIYVAPHLIGG